MKNNTAILLFGRSASAEAHQKYFGTSRDSYRVTSGLLNRTRRTLGRSGLPVLQIDEKRQRGDHFGARLVDAMAQGFALGYEQLIVVGSDCPDLRLEHLARAVGQVSSGASVLGPDQRGGVWLLGICREQFCKEDFLTVRWRSESAFSDLKTLLGKCSLLPKLADVNAKSDLRAHWYRWRALLTNLASLWASSSVTGYPPALLSGVRLSAPDSGRAPPRPA